MKPYAELLEYNQPSTIRRDGFTRIRDTFSGLSDNPERIMEFAGRWDYGANNASKLGETSMHNGNRVPIIQKYLAMGHESMIEMGEATFFIECSRVVSHELIRHRIASYQQESQRFVKYDNETADDIFYIPDGDDEVYRNTLHDAFNKYLELRSDGVSPQLARYVLPNAMRTRLVMKANLRQWRHIIKLRLDTSAQPEMRELMQQIYDQLMDVFPNALHEVMDGERGVR